MFSTPGARYVLRAIVAAVLAGLGALATALTDGDIGSAEYVSVASAVFGAFAVYLGVGASTPAVEPFVGNQYNNAEVPESKVVLTED